MADIYYLQNRKDLYVLSPSQLCKSIAASPVEANGPFVLFPRYRQVAKPPKNRKCSKILPNPETYIERLWDNCGDLRRP